MHDMGANTSYLSYFSFLRPNVIEGEKGEIGEIQDMTRQPDVEKKIKPANA